ncbi:hypothetical protein VTK26DRAFT_2598 [Humicola hyalothermophila]
MCTVVGTSIRWNKQALRSSLAVERGGPFHERRRDAFGARRGKLMAAIPPTVSPLGSRLANGAAQIDGFQKWSAFPLPHRHFPRPVTQDVLFLAACLYVVQVTPACS